ncbi:hypothetical protein [Rhizobium sp. CG5]|uniref:GHMP family kinase ATP-binding protein n=1 Tax=Rhizobium sp. CG5 TaxID=2726076 RepID=UPI00203447AD|nr:hypothetical protein [Rhizobium sp. CG5]
MGCGYGSSTADVVARIDAIAAAAHAQINRTTLRSLAVVAETATEAIAFGGQTVRFAHREGRVLDYLPGDDPPPRLSAEAPVRRPCSVGADRRRPWRAGRA